MYDFKDGIITGSLHFTQHFRENLNGTHYTFIKDLSKLIGSQIYKRKKKLHALVAYAILSIR